MKAVYLPRKMKPVRVLGAYTEDGDPKPNPVYEIGPVVEMGCDFKVTKGNKEVKCNHATFIDNTGHYDLISYLEILRDECPGIYEVGRGPIGSHVSSEVDCESLFSQADVVADSRRARLDIRFYERLVMAKHRLSRVYCHIPDVVDLYMKRWSENDWKEDDERDAREFLELEKKIFLEKYPRSKEIFNDEGEEEEQEEKFRDNAECVGSTEDSKPLARVSKKPAAEGKKKKKSLKKRKATKKKNVEDVTHDDNEGLLV